MPKVKLNIGNRPYEISCGAGDEDRVASLAGSLDTRVTNIAKSLGQASEAMVLVVTALMMEDEIRNLSSSGATIAQNDDAIKQRINRAIAEALAPYTEKLEALANSIEIE